ncbi:DUF3795 domain-containing protein [Clostridium faecium]|uniref:DUF3795 domain-containing protein n=1 Tax=Clostridium faecium TaxID=2762223 RepID=A0ABR8YNI1_9CLOT|nr:DUF3795 domain-containing protein [Clostridium faecium]MBD8045797.1 DUF3795 domain-containing protein [Clostridium faecium]
MSISYCGLNCLKCDIYKFKLCRGCKIKKKDWGCSIRKCCKEKNMTDCYECKIINCKNYKKIIYKLSRPFMQFDLEKNRMEKLKEKVFK